MVATLLECPNCGWPALAAVGVCVRCSSSLNVVPVDHASHGDEPTGPPMPGTRAPFALFESSTDELPIAPFDEPDEVYADAALPGSAEPEPARPDPAHADADADADAVADEPVVDDAPYSCEPDVLRQIAGQMPPMEIFSAQQAARLRATQRRHVRAPGTKAPRSTRAKALMAGAALLVLIGAVALDVNLRSNEVSLARSTPVRELPWRDVAAAGNRFHLALPNTPQTAPDDGTPAAERAVFAEIPDGVVVRGWSLTGVANSVVGLEAFVQRMAEERGLYLESTVPSAPSAAGEGLDAELTDATHRILVRLLGSGPITIVVEVEGPAGDPRLQSLFDHAADSIHR